METISVIATYIVLGFGLRGGFPHSNSSIPEFGTKKVDVKCLCVASLPQMAEISGPEQAGDRRYQNGQVLRLASLGLVRQRHLLNSRLFSHRSAVSRSLGRLMCSSMF
jgi:hypothetical protein